jgi:hypothetical protein
MCKILYEFSSNLTLSLICEAHSFDDVWGTNRCLFSETVRGVLNKFKIFYDYTLTLLPEDKINDCILSNIPCIVRPTGTSAPPNSVVIRTTAHQYSSLT